MSPTKPIRHILRSSSNSATAPGSQEARRPPSGRGSVHALANKMAAVPQPSDVTSPPPITEQNEFSGLISRAKEGLSTSSSRTFHKTDHQEQQQPVPQVPEKSETEVKWEEIEKNMARSLKVQLTQCLLVTQSQFSVKITMVLDFRCRPFTYRNVVSYRCKKRFYIWGQKSIRCQCYNVQ